jgi:glycosyltransferase involved in cell wall biosynthesis
MIRPLSDMTPPAMSIGMPVYNGEPFIREALDSLIGQSYKNFELIISDNASTDDTSKICQEYAARDSRILYVKQTENMGPGPNFSFVLSQARGKYFMWAASDDVWSENWIEDNLEAIMSGKADAAFGKIQCIDGFSNNRYHYVNKQTFMYVGPKWLRLVKYFIEFEGAGKANPIYAVWRTAQLQDIVLSDYRYDYLLVFKLLGEVGMVSSKKAKLYKRLHSACEGGAPQLEAKDFISAIKRPIKLMVKQYQS